MNTIYKTICAIVGAVALNGCTSTPRVANFDYVRPDQCLCKDYVVACKYHSSDADEKEPRENKTEKMPIIQIAEGRKPIK